MSPLGIFSIFSRLASIYTLFAALVLSTLWISSLTLLSTPSNSTELIADAGADLLNPFLVTHSASLNLDLGISEGTYATLQAQKSATVALPAPFKITVPASDIAGKPYATGLHTIYTRIASAYYTGGAGAVLQVNLPPQLQQFIPDFGLFDPNALPIAPGGPSAVQLPSFLQPLFTVVLLSPNTFTAAGHQQVLDLLPWFWLATLVTGVVAFLLKRSQDGQKLSGIAHSVIHTTWPIVAIVIGLLVVGPHISAIAPYTDIVGVIARSFLPVYGGALIAGLLALYLPKILANRAASKTPEPVTVGVRGNASVASSTVDSPFAPMRDSSATAAPQSWQADTLGTSLGTSLDTGAADTPTSGGAGEP